MKFKLVESVLDESGSNQKVNLDPKVLSQSEKAFGVQVQRSDGVLLPGRVWLPKSQCTLTRNPPFVTLTIPNWLYKKKFFDQNVRIFTGY